MNVTLAPVDASAIGIGIDVGSRAVGVAAARIEHVHAPLCLTTLRASKRWTFDRRMDTLCDQVATTLLAVCKNGPVVCVAVEQPHDRFRGDQHDTAFVLGRAYERVWVLLRTLALPRYAVSPAQSSLAVRCPAQSRWWCGRAEVVSPAQSSLAVRCRASASKADRTAQAKLLVRPFGDDAELDALDTYAALLAGLGVWQTERIVMAAHCV